MEMWSFLDVIFVGSGLYMFYSAYNMKTSGDIKASFLLPQGIEAKKCKDPEGYIRFILPKILIFASATLLIGIIGLVNTYVQPLGAVQYVLMAVFMAVLVWFAIVSKKGIAMFW